MAALSELFSSAFHDPDHSADHSLTLRLEWECGKYYVPYEGFAEWSELYYNADYDYEEDDLKTLIVPENIIAYIFWEERLIFVLAAHFERLCRDVRGFGFTLLAIPSFDRAEICCDLEKPLPYPFSAVTWIDDDFMDDENAEFDFDAFYQIDAGTRYLNPKHFSVDQLMNYLTALPR